MAVVKNCDGVEFRIGDRVQKKEGYRFPSFITAFDGDRVGTCLCTVYHPDFLGLKHIFHVDQLKKRNADEDEDAVRALKLNLDELKEQIRKDRHERH